MVEKVIPKEDYNKAFNNMCIVKEGFNGCLFVYDKEYENQFRGEFYSLENWLAISRRNSHEPLPDKVWDAFLDSYKK